MNPLPAFVALTLFANLAHAVAPAVGSVSTNQSFAIDSSSGLSSTSLNDQEGKILVLMLMTPWCSICQSHARAVGSGILDHFNDPARGSLRGKNDNGVPIQSILLSTEENANWDTVNDSFSKANNYQRWGLDANAERMDPRKLLGYYRGGFINSSNLYDWGSDRRRLIVLNLVKDSASHEFREILMNQNFYSSSNNTAARAAINAVLPEAEPVNPLIKLAQNGRMLDHQQSTVSFLKTAPGGTSSLTFTVGNGGVGNLSGLAAALTGAHAADYQIGMSPNDTLAPGQTSDFTITFMPQAAGTRRATLTLTSSVPTVPPFSVMLSGTSGFPAPEIEVWQPRDTKLSNTQAKRDFGTAMVNKKGKTLTFRISNTGDAPLSGITLNKKGRNSKDFMVQSLDKSELQPGARLSFKVTFLPKGNGSRSATLSLTSNDADESPFNIKLSGKGAPIK